MKTIVRSIQEGHILCHCGSKELTKLGPAQYVCEACGSPTGGNLEGDPAVVVETRP